MKATALVTGGAGFIGSWVSKELLALGYKVVILDDLSGGSRQNIPSGAEFTEGSIIDEALVKNIFEKHRIDYVFHLAAYAAEGLSHFVRCFNYENNLLASARLINASVNFGVKCFVFCSSIAVYGHLTPPFKEEQHPLPADPYGIAKWAVERDLVSAKELFDLDFIIFRPHNVYGPNQKIADPYRNVVGIFMRQLLTNQPLTIFGDGKQTRAFTFIEDVAPYIARSIKIDAAKNRVFNIGGDSYCSVRKLAKMAMEVMNKSVEINYLPSRKEVLHAWADHSNFKTVFQPKSTTSLKDGLNKMAEWVMNTQNHPSTPSPKIEVHKNLPLSWQ